MRNYFVAVLLLLTVSTSAQQPDEQLKLRAEVISQRYCEVGSRTISLLIKFKIKLTNAKNPAVLLYPNPYPILLVAKTRAALMKHNYEFQLHAPDVFGLVNNKAPALPIARIMRAGEQLESETMEITVPAPRGSRLSKYEALDAGVHYIQLKMDLPVEGQQLTFVRAISQPVAVTIERNTNPQKCR